jgi:hypothetical protein
LASMSVRAVARVLARKRFAGYKVNLLLTSAP